MESIICIQCPVGCKISIDSIGEKIKITGNKCKRGEEYALQEIKNPVRMLTTTVFVEDGIQRMLPVKSDKELPKNLIKECVKVLAKIRVKAPVKQGEIIYKNILDTGVNIVATRNMEREK